MLMAILYGWSFAFLDKSRRRSTSDITIAGFCLFFGGVGICVLLEMLFEEYQWLADKAAGLSMPAFMLIVFGVWRERQMRGKNWRGSSG